jgi:hypothetical protein
VVPTPSAGKPTLRMRKGVLPPSMVTPIDVSAAIYCRLAKRLRFLSLIWLADEQIKRPRSFFPKCHGKPLADNRRVVIGVGFVTRTGSAGALHSAFKGDRRRSTTASALGRARRVHAHDEPQ